MHKRIRCMMTYGAAALVGLAGMAMHATADHPDEKEEGTPKRAEIGKPAPDFELKDVDGNTHRLSDFKGKTVVLEWFNPECPFVVHLYRDGAFKTMGNELHKKDNYAWLAINSNAPGTQGAGLEKNQHYRDEYKIEYPLLMDLDSSVGRLYDARVTPQMYIIDPNGILVYNGAIDNAPMGRPRGSDTIVNYVEQALEQLRKGETVTPDTTRPYGCTVKYPQEARPQREREGRGERREGRR